MRKLVLLAFLFLVSAVSYAQPSIVFDAETYDFGTVSKVDTIEHVFEFTNTGDQEIVIDKLIPS